MQNLERLVKLKPRASTVCSAELFEGNFQSTTMKSNQSGMCIDGLFMVFMCYTQEHCRFEIKYVINQF